MNTPNSVVRKRILVVEDEPSIAKVCQRVLTREGFEIDFAVNGKAAQDMIIRNQYSLCLIDMRTPIMNGMELYQWLKQEKPELVQSVIFTTGDVMREDIRYFLEQVGRPFLPKPFTPDELMVVIKQALKAIVE
jgi:CheY-like chemotaxis protein